MILELLSKRKCGVGGCDRFCFFFFFKQKTAYEMCGRDWSSDVCSSDLGSGEGEWRGERVGV